MSFVIVDSEPRERAECVDDWHDGDDGRERGGGGSKIVSESAICDVWDGIDFYQQSIVDECEEEGGEGASLFDPSADAYGSIGMVVEGGRDADIVE